MIARIVGVLLAGTLAGSAVAQQEKSDLEKLKGVWVLKSIEKDGRKEEGKEEIIFTFDKDKMTMPEGTGTIKLDPAKNPKEMDLLFKMEGKPGSLLLKAIYRLEGDELKICFIGFTPRIKGEEKKDEKLESPSRPKTFSSESGGILLTLKRK